MINNNLISKEWCDIIFDGRNKVYGAYKIRIESSRRCFLSLFILLIIVLIPVFFYVIVSFESKQKVTMTEVTQLSDLHRPDAIKDVSFKKPKLNSLIKSSTSHNITFSAPILKNDADVDVSKELLSQDELLSDTLMGYLPSGENNLQNIITTNGSDEDATDTKLFQIVQQLPEYPGGMTALIEFLTKNLQYPNSSVRDSVQGKVTVEFIINKDGTVSDMKILRHLNKECDKEALRVLSMMKKWKPGIEHNKPVNVKFVVPIEFKL
jgi:protein TonB